MATAAPHQPTTPRPTRNVAIPVELHQKLKLVAVRQGLTLQDLVEKSIKSGIGDIPNPVELSQDSVTEEAAAPVDPAG